MALSIMGFVLTAVGLGVLGTIIVRAAPRTRVLRTTTPHRARELALKERLLFERILRTFHASGSAFVRSQEQRAQR
ncbi:hypothetical protein HY480_02320, partial [Candidatus Uhrbacteria bacterium]|nr:hypothetical protein [Candidatus Uhrbacteria bacterium]